ncbi:MAG: hypothetical protein ABIJ04_03430 [Bacteroidota bacterium]
MRIAIATDDWEIISTHLSGCKGFAIFDLEGSRIKSQEYRSSSITTQDHRLNVPLPKIDRDKIILKVLEDCDVLIIKRSEERSMKGINIRRVKLVLTDERFVENVLDLYLSSMPPTLPVE